MANGRLCNLQDCDRLCQIAPIHGRILCDAAWIRVVASGSQRKPRMVTNNSPKSRERSDLVISQYRGLVFWGVIQAGRADEYCYPMIVPWRWVIGWTDRAGLYLVSIQAVYLIHVSSGAYLGTELRWMLFHRMTLLDSAVSVISPRSCLSWYYDPYTKWVMYYVCIDKVDLYVNLNPSDLITAKSLPLKTLELEQCRTRDRLKQSATYCLRTIYEEKSFIVRTLRTLRIM